MAAPCALIAGAVAPTLVTKSKSLVVKVQNPICSSFVNSRIRYKYSHSRSIYCDRRSHPDSARPSSSNAVHTVRAETATQPSGRIVSGPAFVVSDNIDTDQIIPAEHLTLIPSKPEEYEKLGSFAMCGLPEDKYPRYIPPGASKTQYPIMIGGANFGCGSSREHAPVAMGAAGCKVVVAESYARIFFRNCVATGELYPVEAESRLCDLIKTGDDVTVDMEHDILIHNSTGKQYSLKPIGEAGPVIDAGGIFNYARQTGMIAAKA